MFSAGYIISILCVFVSILVSMTIHELAHGFVAYKLGDSTAKDEGRLTFNPFKHLDPVYSFIIPLITLLMGGVVFGGAKPVPVNFKNLKGGVWGMALVAISGPLINFLLAFIGYIGVRLTGEGFLLILSQNFMLVNLGFCCFNMLPIPPLDGSRILYAIAPDGVRDIMENIEKRFGVFLVYILLMIFSAFFTGIILGMENGILNLFRLVF